MGRGHAYKKMEKMISVGGYCEMHVRDCLGWLW
jgi:hypothetical protein